MGKVDQAEIPSIVLSEEVLGLGQESEAWKAVSKKVTEACATHGCFLVEYHKISVSIQEKLMREIKTFFDLPEETKNKYKRPKFGGFVARKPFLPLYESIGVYSEDLKDQDSEFQALADLMWPQGNLQFCEVVNSMNSKLEELTLIILRMVFEGLGIGKYYASQAENITASIRGIKYKPPPSHGQGNNAEAALGLMPHVDHTILGILCQNGVKGLEIRSREGEIWSEVAIPKGSLMVFVGHALEVWSNGRLHAVKHKVMMSGDKERYSYGMFSAPKDGVTIEVPEEVVDEDHPLLYRPFVFSDFVTFHGANPTMDDALKIYAGV